MLFLSRQEVTNIMDRIKSVEESQRELNEYKIECEIKHKQSDEHRERMQECIEKLSSSNLTLASSIDNMTITFHDSWMKSRNAWITWDNLIKLSAVVAAFIATYLAIKEIL